MSFEDAAENWESIASMDQLWAILSDPKRQFGKWDVSEFFQSGEQEINQLMQKIDNLDIKLSRNHALDFGCGVGRLTRALGQRFQRACGVDIAQTMIDTAQNLNKNIPNLKFKRNNQPNLKIFPDNHFDLIYSNIVLQHIPNKRIILDYLADFVRILKKDGLIVFQLPSHIPFKKRLFHKSRLFSFLKKFGIKDKFLYFKLGLHPLSMNFIPESQVRLHVTECKGKIIDIQKDSNAGPSMDSNTYFVTK